MGETSWPEALHYATQEPGAQVLMRHVSAWLPVDENGGGS